MPQWRKSMKPAARSTASSPTSAADTGTCLVVPCEQVCPPGRRSPAEACPLPGWPRHHYS